MTNLWLHYDDGREQRRENVEIDLPPSGPFDFEGRSWDPTHTVLEEYGDGTEAAWVVCREQPTL